MGGLIGIYSSPSFCTDIPIPRRSCVPRPAVSLLSRHAAVALRRVTSRMTLQAVFMSRPNSLLISGTAGPRCWRGVFRSQAIAAAAGGVDTGKISAMVSMSGFGKVGRAKLLFLPETDTPLGRTSKIKHLADT